MTNNISMKNSPGFNKLSLQLIIIVIILNKKINYCVIIGGKITLPRGPICNDINLKSSKYLLIEAETMITIGYTVPMNNKFVQ